MVIYSRRCGCALKMDENERDKKVRKIRGS